MTASTNLRLGEHPLLLPQLRAAYDAACQVTIGVAALDRVRASCDATRRLSTSNRPIYGINTGFGLLAQVRIEPTNLARLQRNIVVSHSAGVGELLDDKVVRLTMVLKLVSLLRGYSGVSTEVVATLREFISRGIYPCVPAQGSVGASGDLAPLAHLALPLLGLGKVRVRGEVRPAGEVLAEHGLQPLQLGPKEGLALLNGTQVSTALALAALFDIHDTFGAAVITGALSVDALQGSDAPFDERIQHLRRHAGQLVVARQLRELLAGSEIRESHRQCARVQDPYSLRCQPQVMGACLDLIRQAGTTLETEANAVTDNPLLFVESEEAISGGNFHAQPVAFAADILAMACAEIGSLAERRVALLMDPRMSGLPPFLAPDSGVNSGFMNAQVTAAALVAENRMLCHPASVDSIPTSANQEDHVSMATHGARRTRTVAQNCHEIVAIELLASCQGIDFHRPLHTSSALQGVLSAVREHVPFALEDRLVADDIAHASQLVSSKSIQDLARNCL